jgi:hypothetical protein
MSIIIITLLFLSRLFYCVTCDSYCSMCSDDPQWGKYGYKLSLLTYLHVIAIIFIVRKIA